MGIYCLQELLFPRENLADVFLALAMSFHYRRELDWRLRIELGAPHQYRDFDKKEYFSADEFERDLPAIWEEIRMISGVVSFPKSSGLNCAWDVVEGDRIYTLMRFEVYPVDRYGVIKTVRRSYSYAYSEVFHQFCREFIEVGQGVLAGHWGMCDCQYSTVADDVLDHCFYALSEEHFLYDGPRAAALSYLEYYLEREEMAAKRKLEFIGGLKGIVLEEEKERGEVGWDIDLDEDDAEGNSIDVADILELMVYQNSRRKDKCDREILQVVRTWSRQEESRALRQVADCVLERVGVS